MSTVQARTSPGWPGMRGSLPRERNPRHLKASASHSCSRGCLHWSALSRAEARHSCSFLPSACTCAQDAPVAQIYIASRYNHGHQCLQTSQPTSQSHQQGSSLGCDSPGCVCVCVCVCVCGVFFFFFFRFWCLRPDPGKVPCKRAGSGGTSARCSSAGWQQADHSSMRS